MFYCLDQLSFPSSDNVGAWWHKVMPFHGMHFQIRYSDLLCTASLISDLRSPH